MKATNKGDRNMELFVIGMVKAQKDEGPTHEQNHPDFWGGWSFQKSLDAIDAIEEQILIPWKQLPPKCKEALKERLTDLIKNLE